MPSTSIDPVGPVVSGLSGLSDEHALVLSGYSNEGWGGLYVVHGDGRVVCVDERPSSGLYFDDRAGQLWRALRDPVDPDTAVELICHTGGGQHRLPLPGVKDPHDVNIDGDAVVVVSTVTNELVWVGRNGTLLRRWRASVDHADAWHLNGLVWHGRDLAVSCLCQRDGSVTWHDEPIRAEGSVFVVATGQPLVTGLDFPHSPRFAGGQWLVCNSLTGELLVFDGSEIPASDPVLRVVLDGYPRGMALHGPVLFVGESATRGGALAADSQVRRTGFAAVAQVSTVTWQVEARVELPVPELYDVVALPREFAQRLCRPGRF